MEEWAFTNYNNDSHPIHIHVNDFQVQKVVSPLDGTTTGVQPFGIDNANTPPPEIDEEDNPLVPADVDPALGLHRVFGHLRRPLPPAQP